MNNRSKLLRCSTQIRDPDQGRYTFKQPWLVNSLGAPFHYINVLMIFLCAKKFWKLCGSKSRNHWSGKLSCQHLVMQQLDAIHTMQREPWPVYYPSIGWFQHDTIVSDHAITKNIVVLWWERRDTKIWHKTRLSDNRVLGTRDACTHL